MSFLLISIIVISVVGTLSHFVYELSNKNIILGLFTSVNESTWEHIKIALTPTIIWSLVDGYIYGNNLNYFFAKFISLSSIIILMPILYYGYKYIFNKNNALFNIIIFYVVIICSQLVFNYLLNIPIISYNLRYISCIGLFIIFGCYLLLTLLPIKNFLFKDPISNQYGYK